MSAGGEERASSRSLDPDRLRELAKRLFGYLGGAVTSGLVYLGDALGLYESLAEGGPATSRELASRTGLSERWVREWLHNQGAAGLLEHSPEGRFRLSAEAEVLLAREDHPGFGAGMFGQLPALFGVLEKLPDSFRTGIGLPYDAQGDEGARGIERGFAPWLRRFLVPAVVGGVPGLRESLERGVRVADIGCGAGFALMLLARAFPASEFHGYEISQHALERAHQRRREEGASHLHFHDARREPLPLDGSFGLALTFDCLHDMTHPEETAAAIRRALSAEGVWLIAEVKAHPTYEENVERNPMSALMYGISVLSCMSSALSEPGGAGLGTLGLPEERARELAAAAGFSRFRRIDVDHPVNAFYEVRP